MQYQKQFLAPLIDLLVGALCILGLASAPAFAQDKNPLIIKGSIAAVGQVISNADLANQGGAGMGGEPGEPSAEAEGDSLVYTAEVILKKAWSQSFIFVHMRGSEGLPVYDAFGINSNDVSLGMEEATVELAAAIYSYTLFDALSLFVGKIDPSAFFDGNAIANDSSRQFLAYPFVSNAAIPFPFHEPGFMATLNATDFFAAQFGIFEDRDAEMPGELANKFIIGELDFHYEPFEEDGNLRLILWNSDFFEQSGFALNMDQSFNEYLGMFARFGVVSDATNTDTETAFSIGGRFNFGDDHHVGLGYSLQTPAGESLDAMSWVEGYVNFNIDENVYLTFDLQFVVNPNFNAGNDALFIPGARVFASFQ